MGRRAPLHYEADETIAIAIIDAAIHIYVFYMLVVGLQEIVDNELGLRGKLTGKRKVRRMCHRLNSITDGEYY